MAEADPSKVVNTEFKADTPPSPQNFQVVSRSKLEAEIRETVHRAFDESRAFIVHITYVDGGGSLVHSNYNYYMPVEDLPKVQQNIGEFFKGLIPSGKQIIPEATVSEPT